VKDIIAAIRDECLPFLALLQSGCAPLFRGADPAGATYFRAEVRRDRRPTNMPLELHLAADEWFSQQFGVRYRQAALFCTGDRAQAARHGAVCAVFPIEGFQFCWSPHVKDLHDWARDGGHLTLSPETFAALLPTLEYRDRHLGAATASGCEVMVCCQAYHALVMQAGEEDALWKALGLAGPSAPIPAEPAQK
jgi:hypothetical protein